MARARQTYERRQVDGNKTAAAPVSNRRPQRTPNLNRASILVGILACTVAAASRAEPPAAAFQGGASSSGWIPFRTYKASGIFFPAKVGGRPVTAYLYGGPTMVDKDLAAQLGLAAKPEAGGLAAGVQVAATIEVGGLTLERLPSTTADAPAQLAAVAGEPIPLILGSEAFDRVVVDIDFARHRLAFRRADRPVRPQGSVEIPITAVEDERAVPLSIDGAEPALFELELGNVSGPLLVTPAYAKAHKLLDGRPTSQRLSGKFVETTVTLDHLAFAGVDFPGAPIALVPDAALPPAPITGGVGLPLLSRFRLVVDYPHARLFAVPDPNAAKAPLLRDRLGLVTARQGDALRVVFVSPGSPAASARFKAGEEIVRIDGAPAAAVSVRDLLGLRFADAGRSCVFTMQDGRERRVTISDFF